MSLKYSNDRLRHEIRFTDEATPTSRAKPKGVMGCEIWVKVLPAGKTAHYMLRWVTTQGEKGPWSETVSATIVA